MDAVVRAAVLDDVPGIVDAYLASWRAGYAGLLPPDVVEERASCRADHDWAGGISSPRSGVAVALDEERIVGVVQASERLGDHRDLPEITMLYVVPASWGGAAARRLLAAGTSWITDHGHRAARLRVVEPQARARRFYEREGWRRDEGMRPAHNGLFPLIYYRRDL